MGIPFLLAHFKKERTWPFPSLVNVNKVKPTRLFSVLMFNVLLLSLNGTQLGFSEALMKSEQIATTPLARTLFTQGFGER